MASISSSSSALFTPSIFEQHDIFKQNQNASPTKSAIATDSFSNELNHLQEQQIVYSQKLNAEKLRRSELDGLLEEARTELRNIRDKTKNGSIVKEQEKKQQKKINRLEYQLQTSKIKLSVAKNENKALKKRVIDLRKDKLLHLQILNSLIQDTETKKETVKQYQKDILAINDRKHKTQVGISTLKNRMVKDIEDFSKEISAVKQNISSTQMSILSTIRERIQTANDLNAERTEANNSRKNNQFDYTTTMRSEQFQRKNDIANILKETNFQNVEELLIALQQSEEQVFLLYHETQTKHKEMEDLDLENKHLGNQVEEQMKRLSDLERNNDEVRLDLEKNIQNLRKTIQKYDADYNKSLEVLNSVSESLMNLLRNVAIDEAALDQQLLSTGLNDRNIDSFLGLIEQRIDDLIQMSKAANHQALKREDFMKVTVSDKKNAFQAPALPTLDGTEDEDEVEDIIKLQPVNIAMLKELMQRKVQKLGPTGLQGKRVNQLMAHMGLNSRETSMRSLHSTGSKNSKKSNTSYRK